MSAAEVFLEFRSKLNPYQFVLPQGNLMATKVFSFVNTKVEAEDVLSAVIQGTTGVQLGILSLHE